MLAVAGLAAILIAACGGGSKTTSKTTRSASSGTSSVSIKATQAASASHCPYRFAVITHGDNGSFWTVVYKGAKAAAADLGCQLSEVYGSQQQGQAEPDDSAENAQIQNAVNAKVNGIVVSDHNPALMNSTIASAVKAGIPVVLSNAGCDSADILATHALTCVGQPEQLAGEVSGQRFKASGDTNVLCVIHQSGQNLLDRCNGIAQGLGVGSKCSTGNAPAKGPACTELTLSTPNAASNPQQAIGQVTAYLQAHPGINAVMALNNAIGASIVASHPQAKVATFDVDSQDLQLVKGGQMQFVVDQQQFQQGYLPIMFLYQYLKYHGQTPGGGQTVPTGPLLVDKSNASTVTASANAGDD
ncbi:MAG TPA: substrate-binding domain-containing protein [Solirubrobacteraceae bacterium]|nr:substrate-binding domain-containing protein [Solirubrobacteraceae bacterium]